MTERIGNRPWFALSQLKVLNMKDFDPEMLRRLASRYRERARTEPRMAEVFVQIAEDMETHAARIEMTQAPRIARNDSPAAL